MERVPGHSDLSVSYVFYYSVAVNGPEIFLHRWQSDGFDYSSDGGQTFTYVSAVPSGMTYLSNMIYQGGRLYGGGYGTGFGYSDDKGMTWSVFKTPQGLPSNIVRRIAFGQNGRIFVATDGGLAFTDDLGANWQTKGVAQGLVDAETYDILIEGTRVYTWKNSDYAVSTDNGASFQPVSLLAKGLPINRLIALAAHGDTLYAGLDHGIFAMSLDAGETWAYMPETESGLPNYIRTFHIWDDHFVLNTDSGLFELE
jgi:photosystem II stability/assembly factor-like uncharacterized protein